MAIFPFQPATSDYGDPTILRTPWDIVQLGEYVLPGISTVDISRSRNYRIKKPKDQSYGEIKDTGVDLAKITITNVIGGVSLFTPGEGPNSNLIQAYQGQLDILTEIIRYFGTQLGIKATSKPKVGNETNVNGFAVSHPVLQMHDVSSLYIIEIDGPKTSRPGYITTTFKCIESRPPKQISTKKVVPGTSFAQTTALSSKPPAAPSTTTAATGPKAK